MTPREDQARRKLVVQWQHKAEQDLAAAESLLRQEPPILYPACFLSQQAAEKYLKAFLTWHQVEFPKTHVMEELLTLVAEVNPKLSDSLAGVTALNPYGVELRYPGDIPEPDFQTARSAVNLAEMVHDAILKALPAE